MSDDEDFLITCENLWRVSEDGKVLLKRANQAGDSGDKDAIHDLADRLDLHHVKRRLLLMRAQELAQAGA